MTSCRLISPGVGLRLRRPAFHHADYVQIFDHEVVLSQGRRSSGAARCYAVPRCAEPVLTPLRFPPAPTARSPARLAPSAIASLAQPGVRLRVLPRLCLGISRSGLMLSTARYGEYGCRVPVHRSFPVLNAQAPPAMLTLDVRFESLKRVASCHGADPRQTYSALTSDRICTTPDAALKDPAPSCGSSS